jgi:hypothetical protein
MLLWKLVVLFLKKKIIYSSVFSWLDFINLPGREGVRGEREGAGGKGGGGGRGRMTQTLYAHKNKRKKIKKKTKKDWWSNSRYKP